MSTAQWQAALAPHSSLEALLPCILWGWLLPPTTSATSFHIHVNLVFQQHGPKACCNLEPRLSRYQKQSLTFKTILKRILRNPNTIIHTVGGGLNTMLHLEHQDELKGKWVRMHSYGFQDLQAWVPCEAYKQWEAWIPRNTQLLTQLKQVCHVVTQIQKHPHWWQGFLKWQTSLGKKFNEVQSFQIYLAVAFLENS